MLSSGFTTAGIPPSLSPIRHRSAALETRQTLRTAALAGGLFRQARRLPGGHLPRPALVDPHVGEAHREAHRLATRIDADLRPPGQNHRAAVVLRLHLARLDRAVDGRARL